MGLYLLYNPRSYMSHFLKFYLILGIELFHDKILWIRVFGPLDGLLIFWAIGNANQIGRNQRDLCVALPPLPSGLFQVDHPIFQGFKSGDAALDRIPMLNRDGSRSAGWDDVSGEQRHHLRVVGHQSIRSKGHVVDGVFGMGAAVDDFTPFDEAYAEADWSRFENLPAFEAGNRINAYQVYLSMEAELLEQ